MSDEMMVEQVRVTAQALGLPKDYQFNSAAVLDEAGVKPLTHLRATDPDFFATALAERPRRKRLSEDGRLVILAADHPARSVPGVGPDPIGMANRADYLARIVRVLEASPVDGLMATTDIIDDVVALDALQRRNGGKGFLGERVLIGSMNRSGLNGAKNELWDMPTCYLTASDLLAANLDGGKVMWRYTAEGDANRDCLETMVAMADLLADMAEAHLPMFLEPLVVENRYGKWVLSKDEHEWVRMIGVASCLGPSTARLWLKIPMIRPYGRIVRATTSPILMLGGPSTGIPATVLVDFAEGMLTAGNVYGALVGRNILYPGADDPAVMARAVCHVVHNQLGAEAAAAEAAKGGRL
ncbi:MAG: aldolase [Planctomycetes bacterium]|nr:aldolase [Planctomycetota bacterium]